MIIGLVVFVCLAIAVVVYLRRKRALEERRQATGRHKTGPRRWSEILAGKAPPSKPVDRAEDESYYDYRPRKRPPE